MRVPQATGYSFRGSRCSGNAKICEAAFALIAAQQVALQSPDQGFDQRMGPGGQGGPFGLEKGADKKGMGGKLQKRRPAASRRDR